jgi:hypothetical protein
MKNAYRYAVLLAAALLFAQTALAQNCSSPPQGAGDAWWQAFSNWCSACGGMPNSDSKTCSAGANWGRASNAEQSPSAAGATQTGSARPAPLAGQWNMTATCGSASETYTFNIEAVSDGVVTLSGGAWNCKLESGRIDGTRITLSCSNWLNKVDYQGTLVSDNFMQGSFTQRLRAETCHWSALKAGTTAPEARGTAQAGPAATTVNAPAGDVFVGTITKGNLAKGWGFSVINMKIFVAAQDGTEKIFFIREDSLITLADGTGTNVRSMSMSIKGKKVEIRHAPIRDDTGGSPSGSGFSYEIGQNGVLSLRFLE